jgi:hypothetical protein
MQGPWGSFKAAYNLHAQRRPLAALLSYEEKVGYY